MVGLRLPPEVACSTVVLVSRRVCASRSVRVGCVTAPPNKNSFTERGVKREAWSVLRWPMRSGPRVGIAWCAYVLGGKRSSQVGCGGVRNVVFALSQERSNGRVAVCDDCCRRRLRARPSFLSVGAWTGRWVEVSLLWFCSWDSDHYWLIVVGSEPWCSHCPKNVEWVGLRSATSAAAGGRRSTVVLFGRRRQMSSWRLSVVASPPLPKRTPSGLGVCGVKRGAWTVKRQTGVPTRAPM